MSRNLRKFFANIIGAFVCNKCKRRRIRTNIVANLRHCKRFVYNLYKNHNIDINILYGGGAKSLVITINKESVYKFSCQRNANLIVQREYDIVKYFKSKLPVYIPDVVLLKDGNNLVRKYEYVNNMLLSSIPQSVVLKNADYIAKQIAEVLYVMALDDPECLKCYKSNPDKKPSMFYGWNHGDFLNWDNIFINPNTLKITAIIDWENVYFGDLFTYINKSKENILKPAIIKEYKKLWTSYKQ